MQTLLLKEGFINVFSTQFLNKIKEQNKFIHLNQNELNISYNLDVFDLNGKKFEDNELILQDILYELEKKFSHLKEYFVDDNFELFYVKYKDEDQYTVTMYQLKDGKLLTGKEALAHCIKCGQEAGKFITKENILQKMMMEQ